MIPTASRRLMGWLSGDDAPAAAAPPAPPAPPPVVGRAAVQKQLHDEIGALLLTHGLTATPYAYRVLHAYLTGDDARIAEAVRALLRDGAALNDAAVMRIAANGAEGHQPDQLTQIADALEARIADCVAAAGVSLGNAETFGSALNEEAGKLASDPHETLQRIIALTQDAVAAARLVEEQWHRTRDEADRLRVDLDRARKAAEHDHLTALPNRRCFEGRLHTTITGPRGSEAVVGLVDIDDFKRINDNFGHPAGDRVLKFVAGFLRAQLKKKVMVARYGGEEFALLFPQTALDDAVAALDVVREKMAQRSLVTQDTGGTIGHVTFSAGLATVGTMDGADALSAADQALYAAKNAGKNRVVRAA